MRTYVVKSMDEAYNEGWPDAYENTYRDFIWGVWMCEDGKPVELIGEDGGEPDTRLEMGSTCTTKSI